MSLEPLLSAPPIIQIHALAAIAAFLIGGVVLFRKKGDQRHRFTGRIWVGLMTIVAMSSFFIWTIRLVGPFSPIHILSVATLAGLARAIAAARAHNIKLHKRAMQQLYIGALIVAGFFTFMPGRIMHRALFGADTTSLSQWILFLAIFASALIAGYLILRKRLGWRVPLHPQSI